MFLGSGSLYLHIVKNPSIDYDFLRGRWRLTLYFFISFWGSQLGHLGTKLQGKVRKPSIFFNSPQTFPNKIRSARSFYCLFVWLPVKFRRGKGHGGQLYKRRAKKQGLWKAQLLWIWIMRSVEGSWSREGRSKLLI